MNLNCVIIDDDQYQVDLIRDYLKVFPRIQVSASYTNPLIALAELSAGGIFDILFIDINMPQLSGIDIAASLSDKVGCIIFITAHPQYTLNAFDVLAKQYLIKPVDPVRFTQVVSSIISRYFPLTKENPDENIIFLKTGEKGLLTRVLRNEIVYIESCKNYISVVTLSGRHKTHVTMKEIIKQLQSDERFMRVHQSFLVNRSMAVKVRGNQIEFTNSLIAPMSRNHKAGFMQFLDSRTLVPIYLRSKDKEQLPDE